jgi:hypothetical protein
MNLENRLSKKAVTKEHIVYDFIYMNMEIYRESRFLVTCGSEEGWVRTRADNS